jgi:hypothetical protein
MRALAGIAVSALVVLACAVEEPVVVEGVLVDPAGQPVPGAVVALDVFDDRNAQQGQVLPTVLRAETTSDADGRFEFRFGPTAALRRYVGANTGFVNFSLSATEPRRQLSWFWNFPREMGIDGWVDDETPVRLIALGAGS